MNAVTLRGPRLGITCFVVAFLLAACGEREGDPGASPSDTAGATVTPPVESAEIEAAARSVVGFLQGKVPFDSIAIADSVALYVSPEGGGARAAYARDQLREPSSWKIVSGPRSFSLAPSATSAKLTTKSGRHLRCLEYDLASLYPELARRPHVGTKLEPEQGGSCLQTWNVTFVFDGAAHPRLVAAVYDQWEW